VWWVENPVWSKPSPSLSRVASRTRMSSDRPTGLEAEWGAAIGRQATLAASRDLQSVSFDFLQR